MLVGAAPPLMVSTPANLGGLRKGIHENRAKLFRDIPSTVFFGYNRPGATPSQGLIDSWFAQAMAAGFVNAYDCIKAFSETDFTPDLQKMAKLKLLVLIIHRDDDQPVPVGNHARRAANIFGRSATLKVYKDGDHGLPNTYVDQVNGDLLHFLRPYTSFPASLEPQISKERCDGQATKCCRGRDMGGRGNLFCPVALREAKIGGPFAFFFSSPSNQRSPDNTG